MFRTSLFLSILLLAACGSKNNSERPSTPRIVKQTKVLSPKHNSSYVLGAKIVFQIEAKNVLIDSIIVDANDQQLSFTSGQFEITIESIRVGSQRIKSTVYFGGKNEVHYSKVILLPKEPPAEYTYQIVNTYPHDINDYTQGLLIYNGFLYESTGQNGQSTLEKKDIATGKTLQQVNLSDDFFGEGLAFVEDKFYQLTFTSGACFVYNTDLEIINTFNYQGQGWGITEFGGNLLMTNSSEKILVREPVNFSVIDEFEVYENSGRIESINELEIIGDMIYANVYLEDYIIVIDPSSGAVVRKIDMSGLLSDDEKRGVDVLNGIAYAEKNDRIFVTGKLWPKLFEVKFVPKKPLL